jgi:cobaltochelatase CobT
LLANGDGYLTHHLTRVTREIEQAGDIRLAAIGIGHPVEQYYKQGITISSPEELEGTLVQLIAHRLDASVRAGTKAQTGPGDLDWSG